MILAYLDAGTGSLILQAIVGGAAGLALLFKMKFGRFRKNTDQSETSEQDAVTADATADPETDL